MKSPKRKLQEQNSNSQKSSNQFSSMNRFDYPVSGIKKLDNKKSPSKPDSLVNEKKQKQNEDTIRKARYYWFMRNQHHNQRDKIKEKQQKLNKQKQEEKKQKIMDQLIKKKNQLQKLQKQRQQVIKKHGEALQKAKKINQDLQIKRLKSQQHNKLKQKKQIQRFNNALSKAKSDKNFNQFYIKRQQSTKRNQTRNLYKSRERQSAEQFKIQKQAYDKQVEQEKRQQQMKKLQQKFVTNIQKKTGKSINFESSCYHNFAKNIVVVDDLKNKNPKNQNKNASPTQYDRLYIQRKSLKQQIQEENRQKSAQRGRQALRKLKQAKQYTKYMQEMQEEQMNYNFQRIEAGKRNQFIGLKPQTLKTHRKQKQQRAEQQFEKIFLTPRNNNKKNSTGQNYLSGSKKISYQNRTQSTERSSKKYLIGGRYCQDEQQDGIKNKDDEIEQQEPRNIYTLPYNTKIHGIMIDKNRESYNRNLFRQQQAKRQIKEIKQYKNGDSNRIQIQNEGMTLDYSMTQDENEFS